MIKKKNFNISWIKKNSTIFKKIYRGIERETLRVDKFGNLSKKKHPKLLGSSLTHKWITTDFAENLIEFITPKTKNIYNLKNVLTDLYIYTLKSLDKETLWPLSIPPNYPKNKKTIKIAKYGNSYIGKKKELYRKGLQNRYGSYKNIISGIHYNFSLPEEFWTKRNANKQSNKNIISNGYMSIIRNYYRFGFLIPYLFGSSPYISKKSINKENIKKNKNFIKKDDILYSQWSTSLRMSKFGHTNNIQNKVNIQFNSLREYIKKVKKALKTKDKKFSKIKNKNEQINCNIIQLENEIYTHIRPKQNVKEGETQIKALARRGIKYIEIRSIDINPFSSVGIKKYQIFFLDIFLIWCASIKSKYIKKKEMKEINKNWENICVHGKKPEQKIYVQNKKKTFIKFVMKIMKQLQQIAKILDSNTHFKEYEKSYEKIKKILQNKKLTYSSRILEIIKKYGMKNTGLKLSKKYFKNNFKKKFKIIHKIDFLKEMLISIKKIRIIEKYNKKI
ncbi:glutamate--cysteine ligase [Buchnera aphidicola (Chaitoregma tattakana)]|uniref:glutamate--cysteine ligase n=1 Tax=Buchnera aphidicola TaxID=9 RepID=UPI0031B7FC3F